MILGFNYLLKLSLKCFVKGVVKADKVAKTEVS